MIFLIIWLQSLSTKLANQALHGGGSQGSMLATRCEQHVVVRDVLRETAACSTDPSAILQQICKYLQGVYWVPDAAGPRGSVMERVIRWNSVMEPEDQYTAQV